jgi:hypothetical protein
MALLPTIVDIVVYGFLGLLALAVAFFIWASPVNLVIAFFGLDDPKRFVPAPELPASSAGGGGAGVSGSSALSPAGLPPDTGGSMLSAVGSVDAG